MSDEIRMILKEHGRLSVDATTLADDADLYKAGMTSHASVNVMLALEAKFDIEFPDRMLKRSVFETIASIRDASSSPASGASSDTVPYASATWRPSSTSSSLSSRYCASSSTRGGRPVRALIACCASLIRRARSWAPRSTWIAHPVSRK